MSKATQAERSAHPQTLEDVRPRMAKVVVKKLGEAARERHGKVLARAIQVAGLSQKEAADALETDESTLSRWLRAKEPQQTWRFQQHPQLGPALLVAQAEDETGVVVRYVIDVPQQKVSA